MPSRACPECGLINFATAAECKRCHLKFHPREPITVTAPTPGKIPREPLKVDQFKTPLAPLPDYLNDEPAPYSVLVKLFAVGLALTVLAMGYRIRLSLAFLNSSQFRSLNDTGPQGFRYIPSLEPLVYLELIVDGVVLIAALVLLILLLRKSWSFIKWVRVYLLAGSIYQIVEIAAILSLRASLAAKHLAEPLDLFWDTWRLGVILAVVFLLLLLVWLGYFSKSERVRRIFIN